MCATYALDKGDIVVATARRLEALDDLKSRYPGERLLLVKLDVTKPEDITEAFQRAKVALGRIDVVFNNAGYSLGGEVEGCSDPCAIADSSAVASMWLT